MTRTRKHELRCHFVGQAQKMHPEIPVNVLAAFFNDTKLWLAPVDRWMTVLDAYLPTPEA